MSSKKSNSVQQLLAAYQEAVSAENTELGQALLLALRALGVVYGDIRTLGLYVINETFIMDYIVILT